MLLYQLHRVPDSSCFTEVRTVINQKYCPPRVDAKKGPLRKVTSSVQLY
jgi:hypothetical protein